MWATYTKQVSGSDDHPIPVQGNIYIPPGLNPVAAELNLRSIAYESVDEILKCENQMKATGQCFPVVLLIILHRVEITVESVMES